MNAFLKDLITLFTFHKVCIGDPNEKERHFSLTLLGKTTGTAYGSIFGGGGAKRSLQKCCSKKLMGTRGKVRKM